MKSAFASRLKALRNKNNITQAQLCRELSVDIRLYYHYEKPDGNTMPPYALAIKLSRRFNVSIEYLLGLTENAKFSKSPTPPLDDTMLKMTFADRITNLRKEKGFTQSISAIQLKVSIRQYQSYESESNLSMPSYNNLVAIRNAFGLSIDYLLGNTNYNH